MPLTVAGLLSPYTPVWAAEIEWYLLDATGKPLAHDALPIEKYFAALRTRAERKGIAIQSLDLERGPGQLEVAFPMTKDAGMLHHNMKLFQRIIQEEAELKGYMADFSAKPLFSHYGSGLHVHVHLEDDAGHNLFWKEDDILSPELRDALAGLLVTMHEHLSVFLPRAESWVRIEKGFHAPISATWGGNNRTVALRLPDGTASVSGPEALAAHPRGRVRRIEHRVAGADADAGAVIHAIAEGIAYGLKHKPDLPAPIFGDAGNDQYITEENRFKRPG